MIRSWKVSLLLSLVFFGIPCFLVFSYTLLPNSPLLMLIFPFIPFVGIIFIFFLLAGTITLVAGTIGGIKTKEVGSKKFTFITLALLALILFFSVSRVLSMLKIW
jgi:hypothetical protein